MAPIHVSNIRALLAPSEQVEAWFLIREQAPPGQMLEPAPSFLRDPDRHGPTSAAGLVDSRMEDHCGADAGDCARWELIASYEEHLTRFRAGSGQKMRWNLLILMVRNVT